jgi:hypothetical protein
MIEGSGSIQGAQKHVDPDSDPDPQHCKRQYRYAFFIVVHGKEKKYGEKNCQKSKVMLRINVFPLGKKLCKCTRMS